MKSRTLQFPYLGACVSLVSMMTPHLAYLKSCRSVRGRVLLVALCFLTCLQGVAFSAVKKTWLLDSLDDPETLAELLKDPHSEVRVILEDPTASDLGALRNLPRSIEIVSKRFPGADTEAAWSQASAKLALTWIESSLPNRDEVQRMEKIPLKSIQWVTTGIPALPESEAISGFHERHHSGSLALPHQVTFALGFYPRFTDRSWIEQLPPQLLLQWVVPGWPSYHQMDVLNLLAQPHQLRIQGGIAWMEEDLPYLKNIQRLKRILWESNSEPMEVPAVWQRVPHLEYTWIAQDYLPSLESVRAFAASSTLAPVPHTPEFDFFLQPWSLTPPPSAGKTRKLVIDDQSANNHQRHLSSLLATSEYEKHLDQLILQYPSFQVEWVRMRRTR
jgi:hypothetical protein